MLLIITKVSCGIRYQNVIQTSLVVNTNSNTVNFLFHNNKCCPSNVAFLFEQWLLAVIQTFVTSFSCSDDTWTEQICHSAVWKWFLFFLFAMTILMFNCTYCTFCWIFHCCIIGISCLRLSICWYSVVIGSRVTPWSIWEI